MCRAPALALALAAACGVPAARAQASRRPERHTRALLARADSLLALLAARDSLARQAQYTQRLARRFESGHVVVLLASSAGDATGRRVASGAAAYLDSSGAIPDRFAGSRVVVASGATGVDSVIRAEGIGTRARLVADLTAAPDTLANGWRVAVALSRAYVATLDSAWRAWLPLELGLGWTMPRDGEAARRELLTVGVRVGERCLEGEVAGCRLWLGLDADPRPYRDRYRPAELRRILERRQAYRTPGSAVHQCLEGLDGACVQAAEQGGILPSVPAGFAARVSLIHAVGVLYGTEALRAALADSSGAIGERLARAARVGEDSLVGGWRTWLLTGGGHPRVTADVADGAPVLVFSALLLLAAARSGRWR
jgi:hypothetical protein